MLRWLTGHAFLRLQNFRAGTTALSVCRLCGRKPERADHILLECPRLSNLRVDCFGSAYIDVDVDDERPDWRVGDLLKFLSAEVVASLEEEEPRDSTEGFSSEEDPPPPRVCRRPPHTISTSASE